MWGPLPEDIIVFFYVEYVNSWNDKDAQKWRFMVEANKRKPLTETVYNFGTQPDTNVQINVFS